MPDTSSTPSSSWLDKAENKVTLTGIIFPMLVIGLIWFLVSFFGGHPGDLISHAFDNLQHIIISGIISFALLFVVTDEKLRALIYYIYRSIMRAITNQFANIDPIGIRETFVERLQEKLNQFEAGLRNIRSQNIKTKQEFDKNADSIKNEYALAGQAKKALEKGDLTAQGRLAVVSNDIRRLEVLDKDYSNTLVLYADLTSRMSRNREICKNKIEDLQNDIVFRKKRLEFSKATNSMVAGARAILRGMPAEQEMYDKAGDVLDTDFTNSLGNLEDFLDATKDITATADLQDAANVQRVLDRLNALEPKPKVEIAEPALIVGVQSASERPESLRKSAGYDDLLK